LRNQRAKKKRSALPILPPPTTSAPATKRLVLPTASAVTKRAPVSQRAKHPFDSLPPLLPLLLPPGPAQKIQFAEQKESPLQRTPFSTPAACCCCCCSDETLERPSEHEPRPVATYPVSDPSFSPPRARLRAFCWLFFFLPFQPGLPPSGAFRPTAPLSAAYQQCLSASQDQGRIKRTNLSTSQTSSSFPSLPTAFSVPHSLRNHCISLRSFP